MNDGQKVAAMQIMNVLLGTAYLARPLLAPLIALRMLKLSLKHGLCEISAVAFGSCGALLCTFGDHVVEGTRFGDLALKMLDRFQAKQWVPRVYGVVYGFIYCWTKPIQSLLPHLLHGYRVALETGDMEFAVISATVYIFYSFDTGKPISQVEKERSSLMEGVESTHHQVPVLQQMPVILMLNELTGKDTSGLGIDEGMGWAHHQMAIVAFVHRDYKAAVEHGIGCKDLVEFEGVDVSAFYLLEGLACIALYKQTKRRNRRLVSLAKRRVSQLDQFSKYAVEYCLARLVLLQAELSSLSRRRHYDTVRKYLFAIALAHTKGSLFEEAIAQECYARYLEERGDDADSLARLRSACSLYHEWNAQRKVDMLQSEISDKAQALEFTMQTST